VVIVPAGVGRVKLGSARGNVAITIAGYCPAHRRLLAFAEHVGGHCWWCEPAYQPADFENHLREVRRRARQKRQHAAPVDEDA
jgi:hypothetical protein